MLFIINMKSLHVFHVALITFFNVCGGPWGVEEVVAPLGPFRNPITRFISYYIFYSYYQYDMYHVNSISDERWILDYGFKKHLEIFGVFWQIVLALCQWCMFDQRPVSRVCLSACRTLYRCTTTCSTILY